MGLRGASSRGGPPTDSGTDGKAMMGKNALPFRVEDLTAWRVMTCGTAMREFLFPNVAPGLIVAPKAVSKRLRSRVGEPVPAGKRTLVLHCAKDPHTELLRFFA
jgi:hypothetical protein